MAHPRHEQVRRLHNYCCGYCGVSEADAGGELTVDHYRPLAAEGNDQEDNLVYACARCNQHKGDYWPDERAWATGQRILHPLLDDVSLHWRQNERCILEPLTETGRFHIALLHLNRAPLVAHRERKQAIALQDAQTTFLLSVIEIQSRAIETMKQYIADLEK